MWANLTFSLYSLILPSISLINYDGIKFSERKPYFKPDYQINLKREMMEYTENPSN